MKSTAVYDALLTEEGQEVAMPRLESQLIFCIYCIYNARDHSLPR